MSVWICKLIFLIGFIQLGNGKEGLHYVNVKCDDFKDDILQGWKGRILYAISSLKPAY